MQTTNVSAQKINGTIIETFEIVIVAFLVTDQANKIKFFEKTFLVANISSNMVLGMFFFILNSTNINFSKREF